jgi:hypothetical protein
LRYHLKFHAHTPLLKRRYFTRSSKIIMASPALLGNVGKILALGSAVLVIPVLAFVGQTLGNGSAPGTGSGNSGGSPPIRTVPEANAGLVLIPFFGAVVLFSSLHVMRAKAAQKNNARS